jgi:hypothetical protein
MNTILSMLKFFYNEEIKQKVYEFYKNDFIFFKNLSKDYTNNTL